MRKSGIGAAWIISFSLFVGVSYAQEKTSDAVVVEDESVGILPIPDYSGSISERMYMLGDFDGARTQWAENGFQFDIDYVNWTDSILDGGTDDDTHLGGNLTYNFTFDLMRAGLIPGAVIQVRAESRYGESGNLSMGQLVPMNTVALSPTNYSDIDGGYDLALTQLSYLQFFSEQFGVTFGKLDMYGAGDMNEFAGGRGRTQFMNWSMNYGTSFLFIPASTLGAGVIYLPDERTNITSLITSGTECTRSDCFDDLDDKGGISITSVSHQYAINNLPGGITGTYVYFFDGEFTKLDSISFVPTEGLVTSSSSTSWIASASFWQYLWSSGSHQGPVNLTNMEPDLQGGGVFARLSFADEETNPWKTSLAVGLGGRGLFDSRPDDLYGIGYFYNELSEGRFIDLVDDGRGFEAYYNFAISPGVRLSANAQYNYSTVDIIDDAFVLSTRLQVRF